MKGAGLHTVAYHTYLGNEPDYFGEHQHDGVQREQGRGGEEQVECVTVHLQTAVAVPGRRDDVPGLDRLEQGLGGEGLHAFRHARPCVTAERVTNYTTGEEDER